MKIKKALLVTLAGFTSTAILCAQSSYESELTALEGQHYKAIAAAVMRIERSHKTALEQLMQRAMQNGDVETALTVSEKLAAIGAPVEPSKSAVNDTESLIGRWIHKSSSGFAGEDEFLPDGKFRSGSRFGTWKKVGSHIETTVGDYLDYYRLPVRDGKIYGTNKNGAFSIVLTKIPQ
jgi:hypothetical protein